MGYVLGLDVGSSSMKGIVLDRSGSLIAEHAVPYKMTVRLPGYSEQDPNIWLEACQQLLTVFSETVSNFSEELAGISFSGQMHSLVVLNGAHEPVYPAILWNDVRTSAQCQKITKQFGTQILTITKNRVLEGFTLPKIVWLQENEPAVWGKVRHIILPKDYVSLYLTGNLYMEYSDAAGTLLMDIEKKEWSQEILKMFHIPQTYLPPLVASMSEVGQVAPAIQERFGWKQTVRVFAGGADNACAALGTGIIEEETGLVSVGTSGVFSAFEEQNTDYQGQIHFFNHVIADKFYTMGVTLSAGNALNWFKETFAKEASFDELLAGVSEISSGSDNLLFTPYIVGERTPYFDSNIRGSFIGIDVHHTLQHFTRAVMEGVIFSLKDTKLILEQVKNKQFKRIVSVGGGARNRDWLQMQADIFDAEMILLNSEQGPGIGACMIAALGLGWYKSVEEAVSKNVFYREKVIYPQTAQVERYKEVYEKWQKVYQATKDLC